jgi:CheY-like chemotaxis protein
MAAESPSVPAEISGTASKLSLEARLLKFYLQIVLEIKNTRAGFVKIDLGAEQLRCSLYQDPSAETAIKEISLAADLGNPFLAFFLDRVSYWPDAGDELLATNQEKTKRLFVAPGQQNSFVADFYAQKKLGQNNTLIQLSNIQFQYPATPLGLLTLESETRDQLERMLREKSGLIITSCAAKPHGVDGAAIILAHRPEASFVKFCTSEKTAGEVLQRAASHLVVVGTDAADPVEAALSFLAKVSSHPQLVEQFVTRFLGAFIHRRIRRVCRNCARSTPVDPRTLDRLPVLLRSRAKSAYLFGRGCDICGHSAYRGTVGLSSVFFADDSIRHLLRQNASAAEITRAAYTLGTRALLEDGMKKIFSDLTSFEEVFSVTTNISAAFSGAIAAADADSGSKDGAGEIEALDGQAFDTDEVAVSSKAESDKRKVMIVEDDNDQRLVLESVFRTAGYEVIGADNGRVALQTLTATAVDLIICDVMMPVMNGAQFMKQLRATPAFKQVPVLMLTAVSSPSTECAFLEHGADDYCEKNVQRKVLLMRAERLLKKRPKNPLQHMLQD